jgi:hypothetical protein
LAVGAEVKVIASVLPSFKDEGNPVPSIMRSASPLGLIPVFGVTDVAVMPTAIGAPDTGIYPAASLTFGYHAVPATAATVQVIYVVVVVGSVQAVLENMTSVRVEVGRPVPTMVRVFPLRVVPVISEALTV